MDSDLTRRDLLGKLALGAVAGAAGAAEPAKPSAQPAAKPPVKPAPSVTGLRNADFYKDGKFDQDAAKRAFYKMFERYHFPVSEPLKKIMWVADFGLGRFLDVGMGGVFWYNDKANNYFGHEIFLLPGQMIPEHRHVKTADAVAKHEAWQVRNGLAYLFSNDEATPGAELRIPASERKNTTCRHCSVLRLHEVKPINKVEAPHFMVGGPEGVIVTEYATYHDGNALRFTNPAVKL
jgi:hypothetical protein